MKVITEAILREELRASEPEVYYIPEGKILSPAGREYLQQRKIKISNEARPLTTLVSSKPIMEMSRVSTQEAKFIDFESGAFYVEKPEHMTHLYGNVLVPKCHPRILYRGKLDSLQALIVLTQCEIGESSKSLGLVKNLQSILDILREMMRCDVLDEVYRNETIIGLTHAQLRERSHNPKKFYGIEPMVLPDRILGKEYALLNRIRTAVRETETAAVKAFWIGNKFARNDIIEELNRLSSAIHIMMCMVLAGEYK